MGKNQTRIFIPSIPTIVLSLMAPAMVFVGVDLQIHAITVLGVCFGIFGLFTLSLDWSIFKQLQQADEQTEEVLKEIREAQLWLEENCK